MIEDKEGLSLIIFIRNENLILGEAISRKQTSKVNDNAFYFVERS